MKNLILGLFLTVGFSGVALAGNLDSKPELKVYSESKVASMTCTVTITVRNSSGAIVSQWNEYYTVKDYDFAGCAAIAQKRVAQLQQSLG